jgi:hypothetical protein
MRFGYGVGDYGKSDSWDEMLMKYKTHYMTEEKLMSYVSSDPNYTDRDGGNERSINRVGDISGEPPTNEATNTQVASKLAKLLEGLTFPATKEKIKDHVNRKSPTMGNRINDVFEAIQNNLEDGISYDSVYEIEQAAGLVKKREAAQ